LIGRQVVSLLREGWQLFLPLRRPGSRFDGKVEVIACDLAEEWNAEAFPEKVDAVIHLAQSEHFREFPEYGEHMFRVNTTSTLRLLEYARQARAKVFVLASSGGIYGHGDEGFTEDRPIEAKGDLGFYLGTKLCAEVLAENYTPFMVIIILRFFFVYGPEQRSTMLIPRLLRAIQDGKPIVLSGQDGLKCNPTFVADAASAVCRALELKASHKINVGGPEVLTLRQIGESMGEVLGRAPVFKVQKNAEAQHLVGDIKKMVQLLGPPMVKFGEGISRCIEGREHG
jgi:nucleoside-diphosphate-sugar epimerase